MTAVRPEFDRLPIDSIHVDRPDRQRSALQIDSLKASIARNGLINPIVVGYRVEDDKIWLIAGERRLESCRELGWTTVPVRYLAELSPIERQIIELEENIKRLDLPWQDIVRAVGRVHGLYRQATPSWGITDTAEALSLTHPTVSIYMTVFASMADERVVASGTVREAYNLLIKRQSRADGDAVEDLLRATTDAIDGGDPVPDSPTSDYEVLMGPHAGKIPLGQGFDGNGRLIVRSEGGGRIDERSPIATMIPPILQADFIEWVRDYNGKRFSFIHCDFPYGVGLFSSNGIRSGPQRSQMGRDYSSGGGYGKMRERLDEAYDDTQETYWTLVEEFCKALPRLLSSSGHLMFWLDSRPETIQKTMAKFAELAPQLTFTRFPLIWFKSDNAGIASIPNMEPRHVYETALLASTGQRPTIKIKSDAYSCPTDKSLHPSCKPEAMLRHFFEMLVDETSSVFDPTCGSGTALRAAESLGATRVLGLERDEGFAQGALRALESARLKRRAAEALGL